MRQGMADVLTKEQRRKNMSRIRGRDTQPELLVRSGLHRRGLRYRLHRKDLPGKPDLVFPASRAGDSRAWLLLASAQLSEVQVAEDKEEILAREDRTQSRAGRNRTSGPHERRLACSGRVGVRTAWRRPATDRRRA